MGDILDLARRDAAFIINQGGFQSDITFVVDGGDDVVIQGLATKHHLGYNEDGQRVSVKNAQITINESDLTDAGITTRAANGEVGLRNQVVNYADSTGTTHSYVIIDRFPNETLGHIVCILGDYE
jgi:hypothetical protein